MSMEQFRDLALLVFGLGATVAVIVIAVLLLLLYIRLSPILDSIRANARTVQRISSCVEEEIARPLAQLAALVQGIRQAASLVNRFTRSKGGSHE